MKIKDIVNEGKSPEVNAVNPKHQLNVTIIQPWSNIIVKFKMPKPIFEDFSALYDTVMEDKETTNFGTKLVGQVVSEPYVNPNNLDKHLTFKQFCYDAVRNFVTTQKRQNWQHEPDRIKEIENDQLFTKITSMWFVNQKPGEYNPIHVHTGCKISAIAYLKTPKFQEKGRKEHYDTDGKLSFTNNTGADFHWTNDIAHFSPVAGDFYIFGALQQHMVWPYRSTKEDDLRVSMSFNADVLTQSEIEQQKKHHEAMEKQKKEQEKKVEQELKEGSKKIDKGSIINDIY